MVTKSRNYKHTLAAKIICVLLAVASIAGLCLCAVCFLYCARYYDEDIWSIDQTTKHDYTQTALFRDQFLSDVAAVDTLMHNQEEMQKIDDIAKAKKDFLDSEVHRFQSQKAAVIANEIYYVATHYDREEEEDYYEQAYRRQFENTTAMTAVENAEPIQETFAPVTAVAEHSSATTRPPEAIETTANNTYSIPHRQVTVDDHAPYNARYCQMLVNTVNGLDWLQYASLIRSEAFEETCFEADLSEYGLDSFGGSSYPLTLSELQIRTELDRLFENCIQHMRINLQSARDESAHALQNKVNFLYCATAEDGQTYTNQTAVPAEKGVKRYDCWVTVTKDGVTAQGEKAAALSTILNQTGYSARKNGKESITVGLTIPLIEGDTYYSSQQFFSSVVAGIDLRIVMLCVVVMLLVLLACTVLLFVLCGHVQGADGISLYLVDQIPTDIHLLLSAGCCIGIGAGILWLTDRMGMYYHSFSAVSPIAIVILCAGLIGVWLLGMEWMTSTLRIKKAGRSYFRGCILWKLLKYFFRSIRWCIRWIRKGFRFLLDKPKKIRYIFLIAHIVFALIVVLLILIGAFNENLVIPVFGIPIVTLLFLFAQVYFLRMLDRIIEASCERSKFPIKGIEQMPNALQTLANNLTITNHDLDLAVAEAVKNERTKAELITNVSHDLKTPLTSVISYVDLLKKCDITDPKALEYLDTLTEKSEKLGHLVEDLIEASKVSTGNVTLQPVALNLSELAMQAVVEFTPSLEAQSLEIKFSQPEIAPIIFADSTKTYRIFENLLSNVRKYAAPQSRVYASVGETDGYGLFEIKNISKDPLNVDPQELMERFVRGDASRSEEGNGLGLSIAQQLCALQGGRLEIAIDGDLFKATVYLPKQKPTEVS